MASTTFVDGETLIEASWLNDVNAAVYTPGTVTAADIANVQAGNITATDVQTAINELDTGKQPLDALLTALAAQTTSANTIQAYSGADTPTLLTTGTASGNVPLWESLPLNSTAEKTADYEVQTTDRGKLIDFTGTGSWTLSTASGLLAAGFVFAVRNSGTGVITINPYLGEQIDGASTITLSAGESCLVVADATAAGWKTVGRDNGLGVGQVWTDVKTTPGRAFGTTYYNLTGKPIYVIVTPGASGTRLEVYANINSGGAFTIGMCALPTGIAEAQGRVVVPVGASYVITQVGGTGGVLHWYELR